MMLSVLKIIMIFHTLENLMLCPRSIVTIKIITEHLLEH